MPPKFNRGLDEQMLEGGAGSMGGAGGAYKASGKKSFDPDADAKGFLAKTFGIPLAVSGAGIAADRLSKNKTPYDELPKKEADAKKEKAEGKKAGGSVSSASKRADGIATKGKTRGTMIMCGGGKVKK
jgi:hypothetical protein